MNQTVRCVDLFCGCGGLSLGFDVHGGDLKFETILGMDNYQPAINCYNSNLNNTKGTFPIGRVSDLRWFDHPAEVLLYYLVHYSITQTDKELSKELFGKSNPVGKFLASLRYVDDEYSNNINQLMNSADYRNEIDKLDIKVLQLQMTNRLFELLALKSLKSPVLALDECIWAYEYSELKISPITRHEEAVDSIILSNVEKIFCQEIDRLQAASNQIGRGQHVKNSQRIKSLLGFLNSDSGKAMIQIAINWHTCREQVRFNFCSQMQPTLEALYQDRKVHLLLGGPPCKGFSRIGRAALVTLREQGAHAWASSEFGDERNALFYKYVLFLEALKPDVFIFENVSNFKSTIQTPDGSFDAPSLLSEAIDELSENKIHYDIQAKIVKTKEHAIPQDRERYLLFGFNAGRIDTSKLHNKIFPLSVQSEQVPLSVALLGLGDPNYFEGSTKTKDLAPAYTLIDDCMPLAYQEYLKWVRQADPKTKSSPKEVDGHIVRNLRKDDELFFEKLGPGQRWMDLKLRHSETLTMLKELLLKLKKINVLSDQEGFPSSEEITELSRRCNDSLLLRLMLEETERKLGQGNQHLLMDCYLERGRDSHGDWLERLSTSKPSKTIIAHIGKDTYSYIHPYENRAISIREAARIQAFPDWFAFGGIGVVDAYTMIGNAVPPLLAGVIADKLETLHKKASIFGNPDSTRKSQKLTKGISTPLLILE